MSGDEIADPGDLELELGAIAAEQLEALRAAEELARADPKGMPNFRRTVFQMFRNAIVGALHLRHVALRPNTLLEDGVATDLRGVRRSWVGAAGRIFYLASETQPRVRVLMIGERRPGEPDDCYAVFAELLADGVFDDDFLELGIEKPRGWKADSAHEAPHEVGTGAERAPGGSE